MALRLIASPEIEPVTLAEAKAHLRSPDGDDTDVTAKLLGVRHWLDGKDGYLGRALLTQTWELLMDEFPDAEFRLPLPPLQQVSFIKYLDANGDEQTVDAADYQVDSVSDPGWIVPAYGVAWPETGEYVNAVRVRFIAGWASAAAVPEPIKIAMKLILGHIYENREDTISGTIIAKIPMGAKAFLAPYRVWRHR